MREFGAGAEQLGLRITRAGLTKDMGSAGYDENGRHLAIYVEPVGPADTAAYVANVDRLAKVFLPEAFDRWLRSRLSTFARSRPRASTTASSLGW